MDPLSSNAKWIVILCSHCSSYSPCTKVWLFIWWIDQHLPWQLNYSKFLATNTKLVSQFHTSLDSKLLVLERSAWLAYQCTLTYFIPFWNFSWVQISMTNISVWKMDLPKNYWESEPQTNNTGLFCSILDSSPVIWNFPFWSSWTQFFTVWH